MTTADRKPSPVSDGASYTDRCPETTAADGEPAATDGRDASRVVMGCHNGETPCSCASGRLRPESRGHDTLVLDTDCAMLVRPGSLTSGAVPAQAMTVGIREKECLMEGPLELNTNIQR